MRRNVDVNGLTIKTILEFKVKTKKMLSRLPLPNENFSIPSEAQVKNFFIL